MWNLLTSTSQRPNDEAEILIDLEHLGQRLDLFEGRLERVDGRMEYVEMNGVGVLAKLSQIDVESPRVLAAVFAAEIEQCQKPTAVNEGAESPLGDLIGWREGLNEVLLNWRSWRKKRKPTLQPWNAQSCTPKPGSIYSQATAQKLSNASLCTYLGFSKV